MWDNDKQRQIGYAKATGFGGGDPFIVESKLEDKLVVTQIYPENLQPEYIRFVRGPAPTSSITVFLAAILEIGTAAIIHL